MLVVSIARLACIASTIDSISSVDQPTLGGVSRSIDR